MSTKVDNPNKFPKYGVSATSAPLRVKTVDREDTIVSGIGNLFKLISKTTCEKDGYVKTTRAMSTPTGCVIQVSTKQRNPGGNYVVAEALTFVPGVKVIENAYGYIIM